MMPALKKKELQVTNDASPVQDFVLFDARDNVAATAPSFQMILPHVAVEKLNIHFHSELLPTLPGIVTLGAAQIAY